MWKVFLSFIFALCLSACAHDPVQNDRLKTASSTPSNNPVGIWEAVWVKGFDPDWPPAAEGPFDWTQNQLTTDPDDPGNWGRFYGGCNKLWRYREPIEGKSNAMEWRFWPGLEACTELVDDGEAEILAQSMVLERALAAHIVDAPEHRLNFRIDETGYLIWLGEEGSPVARFKPLPYWGSCESLRKRAHPMPIECHEPINAGRASTE